MDPEELVLCAQTTCVWPDASDEIRCCKLDSLTDLDELFQTYFRPRGDVEQDAFWQQFCSYVVIRSGRLVMAYQRPNKSGDARLQGAVSVGVGGHINSMDAGTKVSEIITAGITRELDEETRIASVQSPPNITGPIWLIRDPTNDVGKVHTGVVVVLDVPEPLDEYMVTGCNCGWYLPSRLMVNPLLETWSRIVLQYVIGLSN